jgi:hypothetical protein
VTRFIVILNSPKDRAVAKAAIDRAPEGYAVDIKEARRSDDQNRLLWKLLNQIARERPTHNGVKMDAELWKCVFMNALGVEMRMLPNLDGDGFFPLGHRSSQLTVSEFSALLEVMFAWCAREGLEIKGIDDGRDREEPNKPSRRAA